MAIFQDNEHHTDETVRRTFTPADRVFLQALQKELNTQSNMGNADPVFWVLKGTQSVVTVNRIQDTNELLAPANVPAVMEFDMPDGTSLQKHCAVNFQTGDIYGVIAPADASDACVIIPFTDKILPCRLGPTPSLKQ